MSRELEAPVVIVGGGPVGLVLGLELARRGVEAIVVEKRADGVASGVKCNHVSARSMEIFRRLGCADLLRNAGLPPDYPHDVAIRTSFVGREMSRIPIPSRSRRFVDTDGPDGNWPTPEPPHRINQLFLEPILFEYASRQPRLRILDGTGVEDVEQSDEGVTARARDERTGEEITLRGKYLVGCDGGRSGVRKAIGAAYEGDPVVQRVQSTLIRAPDLLSRLEVPPAWMTLTMNPRRSGNTIAIDGRETWMIFNYLRPDESDFDEVDRDWAIRTLLGVGPDFSYDVISKEDWIGRRLVANRFRDRRLFICGDAAHLWVPYGGYGMNAGIADADNLASLLVAAVAGWGGEHVLDAYEAERLPITSQVSRFAMSHAAGSISARGSVPAAIEDDTADGAAVRERWGRELHDFHVQQYCCAGLNFGAYYDGSPLVAYDGSDFPAYSMGSFTPSTVPGCRTPHFTLPDGQSLYDALGPGFTLLRFDPALDASALLLAAAARGVPLQVLDIPADAAPDPYTTRLLLTRPDQHTAWRGDAVPADAFGLIDRIRGAVPAEARLAA